MIVRTLLVAGALILLALTTRAQDLTVTATDRGYTTTCAEMDNVLVALEGAPRRLTIRARHPAYLPAVGVFSSKADYTACRFETEPIWNFDLQSHILFEDRAIRLQGHRLRNSWRPELVDVRVGDRTWPGLHLLQLLVRRPQGDVEILVLYPADGYWRAKPLPPPARPETPYGSSFLFGPVETDRRPIVRLTDVRFDPGTLTFHFGFVRGGAGSMQIVSAAADELRLEATLTGAVTGGPFAMVSSMFAAEDNADVGRMLVRRGPFWSRHGVVAFDPVSGVEFDLGRDVPSRHNTLAPDMVFGPFRAR